MEEIKSIWDGWKKQCINHLQDGDSFCAIGWPYAMGRLIPGIKYWDSDPNLVRVGRYIQRNFELPEYYEHHIVKMQPREYPRHAIAYANNVLKLTPQQFRDIDIASQLEAAVKPLVDSVEVSTPEQCAQ